MIKLNSLDSGGKPITYYYNVSAGTWDYGSFGDIVTNNAAPPSKIFPLDNSAAGGIFDHAFVFSDFANGEYSTSSLMVGAGGSFWTAVDAFVAELTGVLSVDRIYITLTEIEYPGFNSTSFKHYCQIGFDVYVS